MGGNRFSNYVRAAAWWQRVLILGLSWLLTGLFMRVFQPLGWITLLIGLAAIVWVVVGGFKKWPTDSGEARFRPMRLVLSLALGFLVFAVSLPIGMGIGEAVKPLSASEVAEREAREAQRAADAAAADAQAKEAAAAESKAQAEAEANAQASESAAAAAEQSALASAEADVTASASTSAAAEKARLAGCAKSQGGSCLIEGSIKVVEAYDKVMMGAHFVCTKFDATFVNQSGRDIESFTGFFLPTITVTDPPKGAKAGEYVLAVPAGPHAGSPNFLGYYAYEDIGAGETLESSDDQCASYGSPDTDTTSLANLGGLTNIDASNKVRARTQFILEKVQFTDGTSKSFDISWILDEKNTSELTQAWADSFSGS